MSFRCDVCGREVNGITMINGMKFCAKCYQETFAIPKSLSVQDLENCIKIECQQCKEKDQRIAELETELEKLGKTLMYAVNLDIERINRIAELEKEKQTTVKEFANEIITKMNEDISIAEDYGKIRSIIISLLKEKGIE